MKDANSRSPHVASIPGRDGRRLDVWVGGGEGREAGTVTLAVFVAAEGEAICRRQWAGVMSPGEFFGAFGAIRDHLEGSSPGGVVGGTTGTIGRVRT